ncbi:uncharacterized protein [Epargyreus clarus]|uniref:uncharacterized protein n=1 Tax=Epargyreus clarus TaxID=520877 RepID=UPI003C2AC139
MKPKFKCCDVESVCGRNLWQGVVFVAIATLIISSIVLLTSVAVVVAMAVSEHHYNTQPVTAMNLVFALVSTALSCYQIVISLLLLWQVYRIKSQAYLCSLWYVSHLSILTLYCLLFSSKVVVCFKVKYYSTAVVTLVLGIIYQASFTYFAIVVNSYLHSLDEDRHF